MTKRLRTIKLWDDHWFLNLDKFGKLTWLYILDTCDKKGIYKPNHKVINHFIGSNYGTIEEIKETLKDRIIEIEVGNKWLIPKEWR